MSLTMEQPLCGNEFLGRRVLVSTVNSCSTFCWPHHMAVNSSGQLKIDGVRKEKERLTAASFFWPFLVTAVNQSFSFPVHCHEPGYQEISITSGNSFETTNL